MESISLPPLERQDPDTRWWLQTQPQIQVGACSRPQSPVRIRYISTAITAVVAEMAMQNEATLDWWIHDDSATWILSREDRRLHLALNLEQPEITVVTLVWAPERKMQPESLPSIQGIESANMFLATLEYALQWYWNQAPRLPALPP